MFPHTGGLILAADYSQLELRIIAHLSRDTRLIKILNEGGDVFRTIASQWKGVEPEEVTADERQQAKQVCLFWWVIMRSFWVFLEFFFL